MRKSLQSANNTQSQCVSLGKNSEMLISAEYSVYCGIDRSAYLFLSIKFNIMYLPACDMDLKRFDLILEITAEIKLCGRVVLFEGG